jgi:hypothetical protein
MLVFRIFFAGSITNERVSWLGRGKRDIEMVGESQQTQEAYAQACEYYDTDGTA